MIRDFCKFVSNHIRWKRFDNRFVSNKVQHKIGHLLKNTRAFDATYTREILPHTTEHRLYKSRLNFDMLKTDTPGEFIYECKYAQEIFLDLLIEKEPHVFTP